jgi:hypothetical protein
MGVGPPKQAGGIGTALRTATRFPILKPSLVLLKSLTGKFKILTGFARNPYWKF